MAISKDQFYIQIDRLSDTFGDKHFPEQRMLMIWEVVEGLEYSAVIKIVDRIIAEFKFAPLPKDFKELAKEYTSERRRWTLGELKPKALANCQDCLDSGFLRVKRKRDHEEWAKFHVGSACCHCERGKELLIKLRQRPRNPVDMGSQFGPHWAKSYDILPYEALDFDPPDGPGAA